MRYIDPDGMLEDDYIFNESGNFVGVQKNNKPDQIVIQNSKGTVKGRYDFNDPVNDVADINAGKITKVAFISKSDIAQEMVNNGSTTTKESSLNYIERESRPAGNESLLSGVSSGKLDHVANSSLVKGGDTLHLVDGNGSSKTGVGYNNFDFGNFLWGQAGKQLGFSLPVLLSAAHANNAVNGRTDNAGLDTGILDSPGDQNAIKAGFYYPNGAPAESPADKYPVAKPWESKF